MPQIKNIIFDLGGVLLDVDYHKTSAEFQKLGVANFDDLFAQFKASPLFEDLETGQISDEFFYTAILQHCIPGTTQQEVAYAWNAMLGNYRAASLAHLETLKGQYNLFLLSNTNAIHIDEAKIIFAKQFGTAKTLDGYFDKAYYSYVINKRKPYADIYQFVLADGNMKAAETVFIDDSYNNLETAQGLGIHTHLLLPSEKIEDLQW